MTPTDEFLYFDVVIHGEPQVVDGVWAGVCTLNRPQPAANDCRYEPDIA